MEKLSYTEIQAGDTLDSSKKIFSDLLENKATKAQNNVVAANAGLALYHYMKHHNKAATLVDCVGQASEALRSGKVKSIFNQLLELTGR